MAEGSHKLGLAKPTVFSSINGNAAVVAAAVAYNNNCSPVVAPMFKISRGTQANTGIVKMPAKVTPSPPVPAKPASLSKLPKSPAPPVPPKPTSVSKLSSKPIVAPKPALPPKPVVKTISSSSSSSRDLPVPPHRLQRNRVDQRTDLHEKSNPQFQEGVAVNSAHLIVKQSSRKSASLGRLEGVRCCALLVRETDDRCLQRDSGFISCSLENVGKSASKLIHPHDGVPVLPTAPPRRRRKSADSYEPIYAVIDFSKKRNRRLLMAQDQTKTLEPSGVNADQKLLEKEISVPHNNDINSKDDTGRSSALESCPLNETVNSSQMDSDIEMIENSFATIASLMESFHHSDSVNASSSVLSKETNDSGACFSAPIEFQPDDEATPASGQTMIARLVFGGTVVQQTDILPTERALDGKKHRTKEFSTALKEVVPTPSRSNFDFLSDVPVRPREPSPAPSSCSSSSDDSIEEKHFKNKHFDPDVVSCGSLGDVDTSDASHRQNSIEDDGEVMNCIGASNSQPEGKERSHSSGLRRTLDSLFTSLSKSGIRKAAEKRKTLDLESSSTDTDNVPSNRPIVSRPAPAVPNQKFNRTNRAYQSVQPSEKTRSNSIDGSLLLLDRRHASLNPDINNSGSVSGQQYMDHDNADQSKVSYPDDAESSSSLMEQQHSDRLMTQSPEDSGSEDVACSSLDGKEKKAYMTAQEIASSERVFVDCLRLMCVDFREAVKSASTGKDSMSPIIPESELNKILNYLPQLQNLNHELLSDFEMRLRNWSSLPKISDVIVRKGPFLKLYSSYIRDFQSQSALLEECVQKYPRFGKFLKQFESSARCKSLSLKHYMLKPVQRLPQYRLLLEVYLRHLNENSPDYHDTLVALKVVTDVAEHANNSMKQEDNFQKLIHLQSRLGNCEIIKPGRYIIKEGELDKVSRKTLQPRYFILLNDCFLYTSYLSSPSPNCSLRLHHELPLSRMEVHLPSTTTAQENPNEFNVISTARSFTLAASSTQARDEWMRAITDAIVELQSKQLTFPTKSLTDSGEYRLGQQAPVWIPDSRVTMCQLCTAAFSITFRRHHCRACGKVVCRSCSSRKANLEYLKFRSARVCDDCYVAINGQEASAIEEGMNTSNCSSLIETDLSASLVNVPPVCFVHAFNEDVSNRRPSSDPVSQPVSQAGFRAQQARRDLVRKERRYIPPRLTEVSANDAGSQISGYLSRRIRRSWKRNWFVLKDRVLYIYKASEDVVALDTIPVLGYEVQEATDETDPNEFQLFHPKQSPIVFQAENATLTKKWIEALASATVL